MRWRRERKGREEDRGWRKVVVAVVLAARHSGGLDTASVQCSEMWVDGLAG